ncbi:O-acyltransferase WSD1 [Camellia lanceoleosa]|uniref:O-acyltransferase WSD1 n=1 Tax=Camellia lanceoleosa TaxID=1840588 RepID=A0ACC0ISX1_9ERIC|nr:O-acyltransferase WSD1 [Camellia lanceoleosa]
MEFEKEEALSSPSSMPVSPCAQYFNSSALSISILCVLEFEVPISIDDSQTLPLLKDVFLPINPRFSSIMVVDKKGARKWKRVEVNLKDHVKVPVFPRGLSPALYQDHFNDYFSKIAMDQLPQNRPSWEIHIIKYPTTTASGHIIFKLHHALGDGYSLMGALLSSTQKIFSGVFDTLLDFGESIVKSGLDDDRTPIHSGTDGLEFHPKVTTKMTFSLDQLKQIKDNLNVNYNTATTGLVLLNTRAIGGYKSISEMLKKNAEMPWDNRFAFLHVPVPQLTDDESSNPLDFVLKTHKMIKRKRNSSAVYFTVLLLDTMRKFRGSEATSRYIKGTLEKSSITITNMIGPIEKISMANHPVSGFYYIIGGCPQSLVVTMVSYMGKLNVVFATEKGLIDTEKYKSCIESAFQMTLKATGHSVS